MSVHCLQEETLEETILFPEGRNMEETTDNTYMLKRTSSVYVKTWLQDLAALFENQATQQHRFELSTFLCAAGKVSVKFHNVPMIFR